MQQTHNIILNYCMSLYIILFENKYKLICISYCINEQIHIKYRNA